MECEKCKYFQLVGDNGRCRRYPPSQDGNGVNTIDEFHMVKKIEWCGEYKERK